MKKLKSENDGNNGKVDSEEMLELNLDEGVISEHLEDQILAHHLTANENDIKHLH